MKSRNKLGEGTYNRTYLIEDGKSVFKVQKKSDHCADKPERSVRIWNQINPDISPKAHVQNDPLLGKGWVCPFIKGTQSTDSEIAQALIDIYNRTGRIIVDAVSTNNFLTTSDGKVVCIDIGMALQIEAKEEKYFLQPGRRASTASITLWQNMLSDYGIYFEKNYDRFPQAIDTIRALVFIKTYRPDISNVDFLSTDENAVPILSAGGTIPGAHYMAIDLLDQISEKIEEKISNDQSVCKGKDFLGKRIPLTFLQIRKSCAGKINNYISSRSDHPLNFISTFRDKSLLSWKLNEAAKIIDLLESAATIDELKLIIEIARNDGQLTKSHWTSGFAAALEQCADILERADTPETEYDVALDSPKKNRFPEHGK